MAGEVKVPHTTINGKVEGDIHSTERLELAEQAVIDGDVYYNLIEMSVGAKVNGGLRHSSNVADDLAAKREAKAAESTVSPEPEPAGFPGILPRTSGSEFRTLLGVFTRILSFTKTPREHAMSVVEAFDPNEIRLSDNAVSKVRALVEDEGNPDSSSAFTSPVAAARVFSTASRLTRRSVRTTWWSSATASRR